MNTNKHLVKIYAGLLADKDVTKEVTEISNDNEVIEIISSKTKTPKFFVKLVYRMVKIHTKKMIKKTIDYKNLDPIVDLDRIVRYIAMIHILHYRDSTVLEKMKTYFIALALLIMLPVVVFYIFLKPFWFQLSIITIILLSPVIAWLSFEVYRTIKAIDVPDFTSR